MLTQVCIGLSGLALLQAKPSQAQSQPGANSLMPMPNLDVNLARQDNSYILGPGDQLEIAVFDEASLSGTHQILLDGTVTIPLIGSIKLEGLTMLQAAEDIQNRLFIYLKYPSVNLKLTSRRPFRVNVVGEVNRPGGYTVASGGSEGGINNSNSRLQSDVPRLTELIFLAGGITQKADIRNVEIRRLQPSGTEETIRVNLWELLQEGVSDDPIVFDGDSIRVPTAVSIDNAESLMLSKANFSPGTVRVNVVGEVERPGQVEVVPSQSSINGAILAAGGFTPRAKQSAQLIRLNPDGTVSTREIPVDFTQAAVNDERNPLLQESDVIVVKPSGAARVSDTLDVALRPVNSLLSPLRTIGSFWLLVDSLDGRR